MTRASTWEIVPHAGWGGVGGSTRHEIPEYSDTKDVWMLGVGLGRQLVGVGGTRSVSLHGEENKTVLSSYRRVCISCYDILGAQRGNNSGTSHSITSVIYMGKGGTK